jgi:SOS-response transcriptional repressor LexA
MFYFFLDNLSPSSETLDIRNIGCIDRLMMPKQKTSRISPTPKQYMALLAIERLLRKNPWGPSIREIADEMGYRGLESVHGFVRELESKGWIRRGGRKWRAIELTGPVPRRRSA